MIPQRQMMRRRNPGHNPARQRMAPQPDRTQGVGFRPMDRMRQNTGQMPGAGMMSSPMGNASAYQDVLDIQNPNKDKPLAGGNTDPQVQWMKKNFLGRDADHRHKTENNRYQRQMNDYIARMGGPQKFQQMLGNTPGFQKRAGGPGAPVGNLRTPMGMPGYQPPNKPGKGQGGGVWGKTGDPRAPIGGGRGPNPIPGNPGPGFPQQPQPFPGQRPGAPGPQQSVMGYPQGSPQPGITPQTPGQPQNPMFPSQAQAQAQTSQRQGSGQQPSAAQQVQPGSQFASQTQQAAPQKMQRVETAKRQAYGGKSDPQEQKRADKEFFGKRGLPLDPEMEEGLRQLQDQYLSTLIDIGYSEADAAAQLASTKERLATNYGTEQQQSLEQQAMGGGMGGYAQFNQNQMLNTDYGRQFQDVATQGAQQQRAFADARASALEGLRAGRGELGLDATGRAVANQYAGGYSGLPEGGNRRGKRKGGGRRRGKR